MHYATTCHPWFIVVGSGATVVHEGYCEDDDEPAAPFSRNYAKKSHNKMKNPFKRRLA